MPQAKVRQFMTVFMRFQNGEIEVVQRFKAQIKGQESFKGALLRLMNQEGKKNG